MNILVAGDYCPQSRVASQFDNKDYNSVLKEVKEITAVVDYAIVNFECPVCYGTETPIEKCGPNLCCKENGVEALKWAGFSCVTLANNHFYDYGDTGVQNTLDKCKALGIDTVGGGMNLKEASSILYKEIGEKTLAIINCCEHEFSIAGSNTMGANPFDPLETLEHIKDLSKNANYTIVLYHGGKEYYRYPSPNLQKACRKLIENGANLVVCQHSHCIGCEENYHGGIIIYGQGNFIFDCDDLWHQLQC